MRLHARHTMRIACSIIATATGACSKLRPAAYPSAAEDALELHGAVIPVQIQNDNMQDLNIYVLHGGLKTKIGIAGAAQTSAFTFPAHYSAGATTVRLAAVPLIGGRFGWRKSILSDPVVVHGGQRVVFSLESDLARSTIAVYALETVAPGDSDPPLPDSSRATSAPASASADSHHWSPR